ncbi:hypothetical protein BJY04DRAFT_213614 [Aspergillus karnatakaensis]|uniref:Zn(II)2Cys6 transcription factor n=1 Tax=Aspergillus karnatakaensis TaxID=1810916 RepID=UPI003CCD4E7C
MSDRENIRAMAKNTRKSMPKVRTGCSTCKQRRIKCDEGKPSCRNCARTGRRCEGYPQPTASDNRALQSSQPLEIRVYNLPFKVPGSQADRQLLHFYCCEAAGGLSSYSDPTLWNSIILQQSHHQPVIRHALVTLSALYRDYLQGGNSILPSASDAAMQRIARCHRQLRLYLRSPNATPDTPLICSILFYAFEILIGDCNSATKHLNNGLTLFKQCRDTWDPNDELLPYLNSFFAQLDVHCSTFDDSRTPVLSLVSADETSGIAPVVPAELTSLDQAQTVLTKLQNWLMHHVITHLPHKGRPMNELPSDILHERFVLYQQYQRFLFGLEFLLPTLPSDSAHRGLIIRIQARMYHAVLLENIPEPSAGPGLPPTFRASTPTHWPSDSLQATLADIESLLTIDTASTRRSFTLCSQLVAILYFVGLKTDNPRSRDMAISLLQHPQMPPKDGLWDARKAVTIIQTMMHRTRAQADVATLEDAGTGILDPDEGGLDEVLRRVTNPQPAVPPSDDPE